MIPFKRSLLYTAITGFIFGAATLWAVYFFIFLDIWPDSVEDAYIFRFFMIFAGSAGAALWLYTELDDKK